MDKEQARFILQSFRPDGADAKDPDFAAALLAATEDRELGDWLAAERAEDAGFAEALDRVEIPDDLRASILTVLQGGTPEAEDPGLDAAFRQALLEVQPPTGLKAQILAAMEVGGRPPASLSEAPRRAWSWLHSASVAAAVILGAFLALEFTREPDDSRREVAGLSKRKVEMSAIQTVAAGLDLDVERSQPRELAAFLERRNLPVPLAADMPRGLEMGPLVGCKILSIGEKQASLLCFNKEGLGTVHLVVVRAADLEESLATRREAGEGCWQCPRTKLSVASWEAGERAYFLLGKVDPASLGEVF